jgi:hypothetical protein
VNTVQEIKSEFASHQNQSGLTGGSL